MMTIQSVPRVIQGGMGVGISGWRLAGAVAATGQLGVVSGVALEVVCARRLQSGDPGGHVRRALAAFPVPSVAEWILAAYFVEGGKPEADMFRAVPRFTLGPPVKLQELTIAANFVEVFLAREAATAATRQRPDGAPAGPIGVNYMRKIEMPLPIACYGAMLAGVDYVLMGAGNPADLPGLLRDLSAHDDVHLPVRVQGATSAHGPHTVDFSPRTLFGDRLGELGLAPLSRPKALAIVASVDLARALADDPATRPDGFVIEGPSAGGHNAPPRGPRRTDERGQPIYDERDSVDLSAVVALGLPVWLAGSYGTPEGLAEAIGAGASGVQVGTAFAYCEESGFDPQIKRRVLDQVADGTISSRADWRVSPTGFPFRVVELEDTLSEDDVRTERQAVCDLGVLRSPYVSPEGKLDYRCPAEPLAAYVGHKGGHEATMAGRVCLCNALLSSAGLPQHRKSGYVEPPLVTAGSDFTTVAKLLEKFGTPDCSYSAADVVTYLVAGQTL